MVTVKDALSFYGIKEVLKSENYQGLSIELRHVMSIPPSNSLDKKENYVVVIQYHEKTVFGKDFENEAEARKFFYSPQMGEEINKVINGKKIPKKLINNGWI